MLKKKMISVLLVLAMVLGMSVPAMAREESTTSDYSLANQYNNTLAAYMDNLDRIYVSEEAYSFRGITNPLSNAEQLWQQHIKNWAEELEILILAQESDFTVKEIISESDTAVTLLVYVWTNLEYENIGCEGITETMGFGLDHIFSLEKEENDSWLVLDDCFIDGITGYQSGKAENFALLPSINEELEDENASMLSVIIPDGNVPVLSSYDPANAIAYSNKWVGHTNSGTSVSQIPSGYNPKYYYYSADCANFVSQCVLAGGMPQDGSQKDGSWWVIENAGATKPTEDKSYTKSGLSWRSVYYFEKYWTGQGYTSTTINTIDKAAPGNPMYTLNGTSGHLMLIVGVNSNGKIIFNAHNNDAYHCLYAPSSSLKTIEFTHNYSYCNENIHTHSCICGICGDSFTESHTWKELKQGGYYCTVCGYTSSFKPEIG